MYSKPPEGAVVTVTTCYPNYYFRAATRYVYKRYENVRVLNYRDVMLGPKDMKIECDNKDGFTIINLDYVSELIVDGGRAEAERAKDVYSSLAVRGSKDNVYTVILRDMQPISCTCPQNTIRKQKCKHMIGVESTTIGCQTT